MSFANIDLVGFRNRFSLSLFMGCVFFIVGLLCLDFIQVLLRYFGDTSIRWGLDVSLLLMQGFAWLSAAFLWLNQDQSFFPETASGNRLAVYTHL